MTPEMSRRDYERGMITEDELVTELVDAGVASHRYSRIPAYFAWFGPAPDGYFVHDRRDSARGTPCQCAGLHPDLAPVTGS